MTSSAALDVSVVLPLLHDARSLLATVELLAERWPDDVAGELVVVSGPLGARDRTLLAAVEGDVRHVLLESGTPTFGALARAGGRAAAARRLLLLDQDRCPESDGLRAGLAGQRVPGCLVVSAAELDGPEVLTSALDLRSLTALVHGLRPRPVARPAPLAPAGCPRPDRSPGLLSIVVPGLDALPALRSTLDSVRRCTSRPYEVLVVNGSTPAAAALSSSYAEGTRVVPAPVGAGIAGLWNAGLREARGEHVALLTPGTLVPRGWDDALLLPLERDPDVAAVGPRAVGTPGTQAVHGPVARGAGQARQAAQAWQRQYRGVVRATQLLAGPCVVLRASALDEVGLLHEQLDAPDSALIALSARLRAAGGGLVVADEVLVQPGPALRRGDSGRPEHEQLADVRAVLREAGCPLLSATLIVKDEQRSLAVSLAAVRDLVDEIVISDTGSTDRTVEVAQALGARVVHRPWTSDFAAARNHALEAATGLWALVVDADEQLVAPDDVHDELWTALLATSLDGVMIPVRSAAKDSDVSTVEHPSVRLMRREVLTWRGAVHETPARRDGAEPRCASVRLVHIDHDGYRQEVIEAKDKTGRNLQLAEQDYLSTQVEHGGRRRWKGAFELSRALRQAGVDDPRREDLLREALDLMPAEIVHLRVDALLGLSDLLLAQGRHQEAEQAAGQAAEVFPGSARACYARALTVRAQDEPERALALIERTRLDGTSSDRGEMRNHGIEQVLLPTLHGELLVAGGRPAEALAVLRPVLEVMPDTFTAWAALQAAVTATHPQDWPERLGRLVSGAPAQALRAYRGLSEPE
ncbi:MAG: glycosyltransferase, partial [Actinomycetota bacterium]|nr:glycosyltransferase [Actinomycetota bacterium]